MALVFKTFYSVDFDTVAGTDINWELDILRSYDDNDPTPSWFNDPVVRLAAASTPIEIEYQRDWEIYKPIQGSEAVVNLVVETVGQYIDLNSGTPFEWQVRLRYRDSDNNLQPYWCGYINPVDGNESVTTFPFTINYTALDGLGLLEQLSVPDVEDTTSGIYSMDSDISLLNVIEYALVQTGLGLDLYVDTGIQVTAGDALINAVADAYSFYNEDRTERQTLKEAVEGICATFNAKLIQANGRFYIYNASTHGGTGSTEETTWKVFEYSNSTNSYVSASDVTETLRYNITGTTGDLIPSNQDLLLTTRRPYGSVECRPKDLVEIEVVKNGGFELQDEGWTTPSSIGLSFSDTIRLEGRRSLFTQNSRFDVKNTADVWVETETPGWTVDQRAALEINLDWLGNILIDSGSEGVRNVLVDYQIYFTPDTSFSAGSRLSFPSLLGITPGSGNYYNSITAQTVYWNFEKNEWRPQSASFLEGDNEYSKRLVAEGDDLNEWLNENITVDAPATYFDQDGDGSGFLTMPAGKLFIRVFHPRGNRPVGNGKNRFRGNRVNTINAYLDNISVKAVYDSDVTSPVFERVQENYTSTLAYEPSFASSTSEFLVQTLPEKSYFRTGVTEDKAIEEIGTQQKLNDFRTQFKYYEGSLINNTATPLSAIDKVMVGFTGYTETASCIFNGGTFNPKMNEFNVAMYVPNQATDIAPINRMDFGSEDIATDGTILPGYYTENIDLVPMKFPGRSEQVVYTLGFDVTTLDASSNVLANGITLADSWVEIVGIPGTMQQVKVLLAPPTGFVVNPSVLSIVDTDDDPAPTYAIPVGGVSSPNTTYVGGNLEMSFNVTLPQQSELEVIEITAGVVAFSAEATPGVVNGTLTVTNNIANSSPVSFVIPLDGVPGSHKNVEVSIETNDTDNDGTPDFVFQNLDATDTDADLNFINAVGNGSSQATFTFDYEIPTTGESITSTLTGTTIATAVDPSQIRTRNLLVTLPTGVDCLDGTTSGSTATIPFVGEVGTEIVRNLSFRPSADGIDLTAATFTSASNFATDGIAKTDGDGIEVPVKITIAGNTATSNINTTLSVTTRVEPYSVEFNVNNLAVEGAMPSIEGQTGNSIRFAYDQTDIDSSDSITSFVVALTPSDQRRFTSVDQADLDIDEGAVTIVDTDGETIMFMESQFTAAKQSNLGPDGEIRWVIEGNYPDPGGNYIVNINLVGTSGEITATSGGTTLTWLGPTVPAQGGTTSFRLVTDGMWSARVSGLGPGSDGSTTGMFNFDYNPLSGPSSWSTSGSFAPITGTSGEYIINVTMNGVGGDNPQTFVDFGFLRTIGDLEIVSNASVIATADFRQESNIGARTVTLPAGTSDTDAAETSSNHPNWTFYN